MASFRFLRSGIFDRDEKNQFRLLSYQAHICGLNVYDRFKKFLNDYVGFYGKEISTDAKLPVKTDRDTLRQVNFSYFEAGENKQALVKLVKGLHLQLSVTKVMMTKKTLISTLWATGYVFVIVDEFQVNYCSLLEEFFDVLDTVVAWKKFSHVVAR
ncbi:hypothetical protein PTKIN_Ptkin12aG0217600 [Pterospermum kingtungense]